MNTSNDKAIEANFGIRLLQNSRGLCFGTDALLLAAFLRSRSSGRAADLGAGSGVISLFAIALNKFSSVTAIEIQQDYAELALLNASLNSFAERMNVLSADIRDISAQQLGGEFDTVFTNPPYMTSQSGKTNNDEGKYIARHEVCGGIADFCDAASRLLKNGGYFCAVWRPDRLTELICAMRTSALEPKRIVFVYRDRHHPPCLMLVEAKKNASPSTFVTQPLIMYENGHETAELLHIYETGEFNEQYKKS